MSERLPRIAEPAPPDVDRLLRDFFRAEMPRAWPKAPLPRSQPRRAAPPWWRSPVRLSLAASLLLALSGFAALNGLFPTDAPAALDTRTGTIGSKALRDPGGIRPTHALPETQVEQQVTPAGANAELREMNFPDGRMVIEVIEIPSTKGRR